MARIQGITIELDGDTTGLTQALKKVDGETKNVQKELKQVDRLLKFDPSNVELLSQKQRLLGDAVQSTSRRLDALKQAQAEVERQFRSGEIGEEQYRAFQREIIATEGRLRHFEGQLQTSQTRLEQFGERVGKMGESMKAAGQKMTAVGKDLSMKVTAPIVALGAAATKTAMDFEAQMDRVGAIAGATGKDMDNLKKSAMELGASTSKSASEVAIGMENMAAMGFEVNEIIAAMPGIISAAEASGADMAQTADVVAASLNMFGLEASEATRVADVLAQSANQSAADITDLQYALKYAGPPAAALGISLEETTAAIGLMTDAGMKGEQAGTTLRSALLSLLQPTEKNSKLMDTLGIAVTDADGKMLGISEIIANLSTALDGMTEANKAATLASIFGKEAVSGMLTLVAAGPEKIDAMTASLENSGGASKEAADKMMDNLKGAMEELGGALETLAIQLGNILIPIIRDIANALQGIIQKFTELSPATQSVILVIGAVAAAIGPLLILFGAMASGIGSLMTVFATLMPVIKTAGVAVAGMAGPIAIAIAAVTALIAIGVLLYKNWDEVSAFLKRTWESLKSIVSTTFKAIESAIAAAWKAIKTATESVWNSIKTFFSTVWNAIKNVFDTVVKSIQSQLDKYWSSMGDGIKKVWDGIKQYFSSVWDLIKNVFVGGLLVILQLLTGQWGEAKKSTEQIWDNIKKALSGIWDALKKVFSGALDAIKGYVQTSWDNIKNTTTSVFNSIKSAISSAWDNIKSSTNNTASSIVSTVTSKFNDIVSSVRSKMGEVLSTVKNIWGNVQSFFSGIDLYSIGRDIISGLIRGIKNMTSQAIEAVTGVVDGVVNKAKNLLGIKSPSRVFMEIGHDTNAGFIEGIKENNNKLQKTVGNVYGSLASSAQKSAEVSTSNIKNTTSTIDNSKYMQPQIHITVQGGNMSPSEIARKALQTQRQLAMEWGV